MVESQQQMLGGHSALKSCEIGSLEHQLFES
jgi:hypothetical protein